MTIEDAKGADEMLEPGPNAVDITPTKDGGLLKEIIKEGTGDITPSNGCRVKVHYFGVLLDGTEFDSSRTRDPFEFNLGKGNVIRAWDIGVATMKEGEVSRFFCREDYAYGKIGSAPKIPPDATLVFEIEVLGWEAEDLSKKKDKGILRYPIISGKDKISPKEGSIIEVHIVGEYDGKVFDDRELPFCLGEGAELNIPRGVEKALEKFVEGEKSKLILKPQYAFGSAGCEKLGVPGNATVTYTVTLNAFEKKKDTWMLESTEKLQHGKMFKEKGTSYFIVGKYHLALKMYRSMLGYLDCSEGFEEEAEVERKALLLAAHLNISVCFLKLGNYIGAKNHCDKALEQDSENVKAFFRRAQANLNLNEPGQAKLDFEKVVKIDPSNKAASSQIAVCNKKLKELFTKEKQIYSTMFEKYIQKKEPRFGWWEEGKVKVEIVPEDPHLEEEKMAEKLAKKKYLEEQAKLVKELKERRAQEAKEKADSEKQEVKLDNETNVEGDKEEKSE